MRKSYDSHHPFGGEEILSQREKIVYPKILQRKEEVTSFPNAHCVLPASWRLCILASATFNAREGEVTKHTRWMSCLPERLRVEIAGLTVLRVRGTEHLTAYPISPQPSNHRHFLREEGAAAK